MRRLSALRKRIPDPLVTDENSVPIGLRTERGTGGSARSLPAGLYVGPTKG